MLLAGPTASGKSALALQLAIEQQRAVINADALQVYECWRVLSARPSPAEETAAPHFLYGHVPFDAAYSAGQWLRDVASFLQSDPAPVIVGGTGLYFLALTEGLAEIPETDMRVRARASELMNAAGIDALIETLDPLTRSRIDLRNPMRVQRAYEVQIQTGRGLAAWHADTPPPLLPVEQAARWVISTDTAWLNGRIDQRFDMMMQGGALDEARAMLARWDPDLPSAKAIGAPELIAFLRGEISESDAIRRAKIASHQYAKRQRTWFRRRMSGWRHVNVPIECG